MTTLPLVVCTALVLASADGMRAEIQRGSAQQVHPAVEAYVALVGGKPLKAPADQTFIITALDHLVSAVEGLALREVGLDARVLPAARQLRYDIRQLEPFAPDTPERLTRRWKVFGAAARLIDDLARELGSRGVDQSLRNAVVRAADSIDYDDPLRWQPTALAHFFSLSSRALTQMAGGDAVLHE